MLGTYYGTGLVMAPSRRPIFAALLALFSILPWVIGGLDQVRRGSEELLFVAVCGILVTVATTVGSLITSVVRRHSKSGDQGARRGGRPASN